MSSEHRARVRRSGGEEGLREAAIAEVREDLLELGKGSKSEGGGEGVRSGKLTLRGKRKVRRRQAKQTEGLKMIKKSGAVRRIVRTGNGGEKGGRGRDGVKEGSRSHRRSQTQPKPTMSQGQMK